MAEQPGGGMSNTAGARAAEEDDDDGMNRHGYPQGVSFVPTKTELIELLADKVAGRPLPDCLTGVIDELKLLDFHPSTIYEDHRERIEDGYVYFFSVRSRSAGSKRSVRTAKGGVWKASGGCKEVTATTRNGGGKIGTMGTLVFYAGKGKKLEVITQWSVHEFALHRDRDITEGQTTEMALYRLYLKKNGKGGIKDEQADEKAQNCSPPPPLHVGAPPPPLALPPVEGYNMVSDASVGMQTYDSSLWEGTGELPGASFWDECQAMLQKTSAQPAYQFSVISKWAEKMTQEASPLSSSSSSGLAAAGQDSGEQGWRWADIEMYQDDDDYLLGDNGILFTLAEICDEPMPPMDSAEAALMMLEGEDVAGDAAAGGDGGVQGSG